MRSWEWVLKGRMRPQECTCTEERPCEDTARTHLLMAEAKERGLRRNQPWWHLNLWWTYKSPELLDRKFLLMKLPSLGYFVIASIINWDNISSVTAPSKKLFLLLENKESQWITMLSLLFFILPRPLSWTCHCILCEASHVKACKLR